MNLKGKNVQIDESAKIGKNTNIWHNVNILKGVIIGKNCTISSYVEIGKNVEIGDNCKIEAFAFIPEGVTIGDNTFIGPHVCFTNDKKPRVKDDFKLEKTMVKEGASIGANSTIICGTTIGKSAMVGAGSVVTKSVPDKSLVYGNPAEIVRKIKSGEGDER